MYRREEIIREANSYFDRNCMVMDGESCSDGMKVFCDFYDECRSKLKIEKMIEVGCSTGFNLVYMNRKYGIKGYGIDPSDKAINFGREYIEMCGAEVELQQGFSDSIPYGHEEFDLIYIGFCLYQVSRDLIAKTISEVDRTLRWGGILAVTDFDTPVGYVRENTHNKMIVTFKTDYASYIKPFGYSLVSKKMYSHNTAGFNPDIQERVSTQIFYKEKIKDMYVTG